MEVEVCMYIYITKQIMVIFAKNKGHFITIKDSNQKEEITIINI